MKIVFICSCLEPGRDGVGDYTRRLAAELIRQGHFSKILSFNDKYVHDKFDNIQRSEEIDLPVLRLPTAWAMDVRLNYAKRYIDDFDPDWLSLQFVIFGFHRKGLPFRLGSQLAFLGKGRRWHIMFHELWVGMEIHSSKKHSLLGGIQRLLIKSLISILNPKIIHTHTNLYQLKLAELGFATQHLSLFSNIPKNQNIITEIDSASSFKNSKLLNFIIFGQIFPNTPIDDFINDVTIYAEKNGVKISFTIIGRCGSEQDQWVDKWIAAGITVNILGEQPEHIISKAMGDATIGISTTPAALIEKSGSVAAMLEHDLPVICVQFPWQARGVKDLKLPQGIISYKKGNLESIFDKIDTPAKNNVSIISHKLADALLNST